MFPCEMIAQYLEKPKTSFTFTFLSQTQKRVVHHRRSPAKIEKPLGRRRRERASRFRYVRRRFCHPCIPGNEFNAPAPLQRLFLISDIVKKILERLQQERTKSAATLVGLPQPVSFQNHQEEILRKVLRVFSRIAAAAHIGKNGSPVIPAKLCQRLSGFLLVTVGTRPGKDETPARGGEHPRLCFCIQRR